MIRLLAAALATILLVSALAAGAAEDDERSFKASHVDLADGSQVVLEEDGVSRISEGRTLWKIAATEPEMPILFQDSSGRRLLLVHTVWKPEVENPHITLPTEFRALDLETGAVRWAHHLANRRKRDLPVSPVFFESGIYLGRGSWLLRLDPDSGRIEARHPAHETIKTLEHHDDGWLAVSLGIDWTLRFRDGAFANPLAATSDLLTIAELHNRARTPVHDFLGTFDATRYMGYLDLHKIKMVPAPAGFREEWQDYDLGKAEVVLRDSLEQDPRNPHLWQFLSFCLLYQGRMAEAGEAFQKGLKASTLTSQDAFWLAHHCESLGLTAWADAYYDAGTALYFRQVPGPSRSISLIESMLYLLMPSQTRYLIQTGRVQRSIHVWQVRRNVFPSLELEPIRSRFFERWLRRLGRESEALTEADYRWRHTDALFGLPLPHQAPRPPFPPLHGLVSFALAAIAAFALLLLQLERRLMRWAGRSPWTGPLLLGLLLWTLIRIDVPAAVSVGALVLATIVLATVLVLTLRNPPSGTVGRRTIEAMTASPATWAAIALALDAVRQMLLPDAGSAWTIAAVLSALAALLLAHRRRGASGSPHPAPPLSAFAATGVAVLVAMAGTLAVATSFRISNTELELLPTIDLGHPSVRRILDANHGGRLGSLFAGSDLLYARALSRHLGGDLEDARGLYEKIVDRTGDARALNNLGVLAMGEAPESARGLFRRALEADPDLAAARYNLALMDADEDGFREARRRDPWRVGNHRKYCAPKPMIAIGISHRDISWALYWRRGGFLDPDLVPSVARNLMGRS